MQNPELKSFFIKSVLIIRFTQITKMKLMEKLKSKTVIGFFFAACKVTPADSFK